MSVVCVTHTKMFSVTGIYTLHNTAAINVFDLLVFRL